MANLKQAEWGFVYCGEVLVSAVDEHGKYQVEKLGFGDIWYFPKGSAHTLQGLAEDNEFLLAFDDGDFDKTGYWTRFPFCIGHELTEVSSRTTYNIADWVAHTPKAILAKNFGVDVSVLSTIPDKSPNILNSTASTDLDIQGPNGELTGNASYVYRTLQHEPETIGGTGGTFYRIDSTNFPVAKTIASTFVTLKPGGLRELHWHPNVSSVTVHSGLT